MEQREKERRESPPLALTAGACEPEASATPPARPHPAELRLAEGARRVPGARRQRHLVAHGGSGPFRGTRGLSPSWTTWELKAEGEPSGQTVWILRKDAWEEQVKENPQTEKCLSPHSLANLPVTAGFSDPDEGGTPLFPGVAMDTH